ncbi:hypothetical protein RRG08_045085 [Elysia crispata]|uniref:Uncharacterized protein n=1 Tax=Elysia crispata TaxID=231223 RepID=A0AAE1D4K3_9GAST|nr:hypothetical protein RRG08_045085 [Elysia crispata]
MLARGDFELVYQPQASNSDNFRRHVLLPVAPPSPPSPFPLTRFLFILSPPEVQKIVKITLITGGKIRTQDKHHVRQDQQPNIVLNVSGT